MNPGGVRDVPCPSPPLGREVLTPPSPATLRSPSVLNALTSSRATLLGAADPGAVPRGFKEPLRFGGPRAAGPGSAAQVARRPLVPVGPHPLAPSPFGRGGTASLPPCGATLCAFVRAVGQPACTARRARSGAARGSAPSRRPRTCGTPPARLPRAPVGTCPARPTPTRPPR